MEPPLVYCRSLRISAGGGFLAACLSGAPLALMYPPALLDIAILTIYGTAIITPFMASAMSRTRYRTILVSFLILIVVVSLAVALLESVLDLSAAVGQMLVVSGLTALGLFVFGRGSQKKSTQAGSNLRANKWCEVILISFLYGMIGAAAIVLVADLSISAIVNMRLPVLRNTFAHTIWLAFCVGPAVWLILSDRRRWVTIGAAFAFVVLIVILRLIGLSTIICGAIILLLSVMAFLLGRQSSK